MAHKFLRVGRGDKNKDGLKNDIQLTHESISRSHLEVFIDEEGNVFITDLDTKNGTFVNGHAIVGDTKLMHGDILKLGVGRPVQWEKWIHLDTTVAEENVEEVVEQENQNEHHLTTAAPLGNKKKNKFLIPILILVAVIFFLFTNMIFGGKEIGVSEKGGVKSYTKNELQGKTYKEIKEIKNNHEKFESNGDNEIITSDGKEITLVLNDDNTIKEIITIQYTSSPHTKDQIQNDGKETENQENKNPKPIPTNSKLHLPRNIGFDDYKKFYYALPNTGGEKVSDFANRISKLISDSTKPNTVINPDDLKKWNKDILIDGNKELSKFKSGVKVYFKIN